MPVTYTHSCVIRTPQPSGAVLLERVPVRRTARCWTDWKRRQFHPETGKRLGAPHTNLAEMQLHTLRERPTNGA